MKLDIITVRDNSSMMKQLLTIKDVITELGGPGAVAKLLGITQPAVSNWITRGIPPRTYIELKAALTERQLTAPNSLWGMPEVEIQRAAE